MESLTITGKSSSPLALERGLALLELVATQTHGLTFTDVQQRLSVPKMTASRLLKALCDLGYLEKADGVYRRGDRFVALTAAEPVESRLRRVCLEPLERLVEACGNSGLVVHWTGTVLECLERVLHEESLVLVPPGHVVQSFYAYPASIFCLSEKQWEQDFAARGHRLKAEGVTQAWYAQERERYLALGFAFGNLAQRHRLASPLTVGGEIVGALVIGGTPQSLPLEKMDEVGRKTAEAASACSEKLQP